MVKFDEKTDSQQGTDSDPINPANRSPENIDSSNISEAEQQSAFDRDFSSINNQPELASLWKYSATPGKKTTASPTRFIGRISGRSRRFKISASTGVVGLIAALTMGFGSIILGPFAFAENMLDRFDDMSPPMSKRSTLIHGLRAKIPNKDINKVVKGCRTLSLRCKMATVSKSYNLRLERAGITVIPDTEKTLLAGRVVPKAYTFRNQTFISPEAWRAELAKPNSAAARAVMSANNPRFFSVSDNRMWRFIYNRIGVTKAAPGTKGRVEDRINQILTATARDSLRGMSTRAFVDDEGNTRYRLVDADGKPVLDINGNQIVYDSEASANKANKAIKVDSRTPPTRAVRGVVGAFSILGVADMACTIRNMVGAAVVAAKVIAWADSMKVALSVGSYIHKMKAGDASPEEASAIGELLNRTDDRKLILDRDATIEYITENRGAEDGFPEDTVPNPTYGMSVMDMPSVKSVMTGGYNTMYESEMLFSSEGGVSRWFRAAGVISDALNLALNDTGCRIVQHPGTRALGIAASIIAGIFSLGTISATQVAIAVTMLGAIFGLSFTLDRMLDNSLPDYLAENPNDTAAKAGAISYGFANAGSENAKLGGAGWPVTDKRGARINQADRIAFNREIAAAERENSKFFDVNNQYSVVGSIARSALSTTGYASGSKLLTKLPAVSLAAVSNAITRTTHASNGGNAVYGKCEDDDLKKLGIQADMYCNIRYYMPPEYANIPPMEVYDYMVEMGYIDEDTTNGLPEGYTPPNPQASQNALVEFAKGATIGNFFDDRYTRVPDNEYARYLEYCVFRTQPFGETFEEAGLLGNASKEWQTGEKCLNKEGSRDMNMMMLFTLDTRIQEALDEEDNINGESTGGDDGTRPMPPIASDQCDGPANLQQASQAGWGGYSNGKIPQSALKKLSWSNHYLHPDAACGLEAVNERYKERFGVNLTITGPRSAYRTYEQQVQMKGEYGSNAATPGTSNHGWGLAVDLSAGVGTFGTPMHNWMRENAPANGWVHPMWARQNGSKPEAWHWEYGRPVQ